MQIAAVGCHFAGQQRTDGAEVCACTDRPAMWAQIDWYTHTQVAAPARRERGRLGKLKDKPDTWLRRDGSTLGYPECTMRSVQGTRMDTSRSFGRN